MNEKKTTTETMRISDVRSQLNQLVNRVYRKETRVIVEKSGIPVAGIVSAADIERLKQLDADVAERWRVLEAMRAPFRGVPSEEIERETDRILKEMREEDRRQRQADAG
jgi:prevent-host-death family protein